MPTIGAILEMVLRSYCIRLGLQLVAWMIFAVCGVVVLLLSSFVVVVVVVVVVFLMCPYPYYAYGHSMSFLLLLRSCLPLLLVFSVRCSYVLYVGVQHIKIREPHAKEIILFVILGTLLKTTQLFQISEEVRRAQRFHHFIWASGSFRLTWPSS